MTHPDAAEWMDFLYDEVSPERKGQLLSHLGECPSCARRLEQWRESMQALDKYELPAPALPKRRWVPVLRLAAAAGVVFTLVLGYALGRRSTESEIGDLRNTVAQLGAKVDAQQIFNYSNSIFAGTAAANEETIRLLAGFSRSQDEKLQAVSVAMQDFQARLGQLHRDLETVAVNTQTGFQQTHQNLSALVSYFPPPSPTIQK